MDKLVLRFSSRFAPLADFFISTSFTLPQWERAGWISRLVDRAIGRNDLTAATRTNTPACRAFLNVKR